MEMRGFANRCPFCSCGRATVLICFCSMRHRVTRDGCERESRMLTGDWSAWCPHRDGAEMLYLGRPVLPALLFARNLVFMVKKVSFFALASELLFGSQRDILDDTWPPKRCVLACHLHELVKVLLEHNRCEPCTRPKKP